jgi:hypothetical protein
MIDRIPGHLIDFLMSETVENVVVVVVVMSVVVFISFSFQI